MEGTDTNKDNNLSEEQQMQDILNRLDLSKEEQDILTAAVADFDK